MARDRPSPYGEKGCVPPPVARGPVPRDHWDARGMARDTRSDARVASEGPRPTMKGGLSAAAAPGGVPPNCIETRRSLLLGRAAVYRLA